MPQILVFKIFNEWFMCQEAKRREEGDLTLENVNLERFKNDAKSNDVISAVVLGFGICSSTNVPKAGGAPGTCLPRQTCANLLNTSLAVMPNGGHQALVSQDSHAGSKTIAKGQGTMKFRLYTRKTSIWRKMR